MAPRTGDRAKPYKAHELIVDGKVERRSSDLASLKRQAAAIRAVNRKHGRKGHTVRVKFGNP